ncbi:MAG TPA: translation initiation factor IF-2, partial [Verrucomicrobiae bacterium]|nr:translation initiation factor IF-2 [Verrucomicrobiae bacterium]
PRPDGQRPPFQGPRPDGQFGRGPRPGMQGPRPGGPMGGPQGQRPQRPGGPAIPAAPTTPTEQQPRPRFDQTKRPLDKKANDRKEREKRELEDRILRGKGRQAGKAVHEVKDTGPKHIVVPEIITVQDLSSLMSRKSSEVIKKLMGLGVMATINQEIDGETAVIIGEEFGIQVEVKVERHASVVEEIVDAPETLLERPPVVTVMGHVDHGKTSLLDAIRATNVTAREAGGITQHIGAYQVEIKGEKITFLDTPGHEAFTAMRARGAQTTDIVILVVAADDGVMPQTVEAINHAKAAGVPIIVAINKIDKENANPDRVKQELTEYALVSEEWGGDTIMVPVSAKAKQNIEQLLEMILLVAEVQELKANPNRKAQGAVVEAQLDKGRGPVATVLVQKGTLEIGDILVAGTAYGKVRAMVDDKGRRIKKAGPSTPVEVLGLSEVPMAGDAFNAVEDDKIAKVVVASRQDDRKAEEAKRNVKVSLEDLFEKIKEGQVKELNVIIKADVQGSIEALRQSLERLSTAEVRVNPIHGGVGAISETDVMLAAASNAIIIGFNVRPDAHSKGTAERQGVDIRLYRVIYDAIEDVKAAMTGLLDPDFKENVLGKAEVRATFKVPKAGTIAGCFVTEGKITRNAEVRVIRDGIVILEGKLDSLKRFKDDVKEVATGYECGISIEKFNDIKEGDIIEAFVMEEVKREL